MIDDPIVMYRRVGVLTIRRDDLSNTSESDGKEENKKKGSSQSARLWLMRRHVFVCICLVNAGR